MTRLLDLIFLSTWDESLTGPMGGRNLIGAARGNGNADILNDENDETLKAFPAPES